MHGRLSYADVVSGNTMLYVDASKSRGEELQWLSRCLLAKAKNCDVLNDITNLLSDAGFLEVKPKYGCDMRIPLECNSMEVAQKVLVKGAQAFSNWFSWICPWSQEKESSRPGKLLWLSIVGVPLHA